MRRDPILWTFFSPPCGGTSLSRNCDAEAAASRTRKDRVGNPGKKNSKSWYWHATHNNNNAIITAHERRTRTARRSPRDPNRGSHRLVKAAGIKSSRSIRIPLLNSRLLASLPSSKDSISAPRRAPICTVRETERENDSPEGNDGWFTGTSGRRKTDEDRTADCKSTANSARIVWIRIRARARARDDAAPAGLACKSITDGGSFFQTRMLRELGWGREMLFTVSRFLDVPNSWMSAASSSVTRCRRIDRNSRDTKSPNATADFFALKESQFPGNFKIVRYKRPELQTLRDSCTRVRARGLLHGTMKALSVRYSVQISCDIAWKRILQKTMLLYINLRFARTLFFLNIS